MEATQRHIYLQVGDWTWWAWLATALLLTLGLAGYPEAFVSAILLTVAQTVIMLIRERRLRAFPVQLRLAYTILLLICLLPGMRWLYWLPTVGTYALVIFGYCLMARFLSLLPWNRKEPVTLDLLQRTFFSPPRLPAGPSSGRSTGCAGGLCTIEAQVARRKTA